MAGVFTYHSSRRHNDTFLTSRAPVFLFSLSTGLSSSDFSPPQKRGMQDVRERVKYVRVLNHDLSRRFFPIGAMTQICIYLLEYIGAHLFAPPINKLSSPNGSQNLKVCTYKKARLYLTYRPPSYKENDVRDNYLNFTF